jgi:ribosomal protein S18 acetylase RimI-like enzyme
MDSVVTLRPMTDEEFAAYRPRLAREYAEEHVQAGNWTPDEALGKSEAELDEILGEGLAQPDTLLLTAVDADDVPVGLVWISLVHPRGVADTAYIFAIEVFSEHRGKGLGKALLAAAEQEVARHGVGNLGLNVFGSNTVARHLYESAGYVVTTQQMRKVVAPRTPPSNRP